LEGSSHALIEILSRHFHGGTEENTKILYQNSRCPDRDLIRAHPEYKSSGLLSNLENSFGALHFQTYMRNNFGRFYTRSVHFFYIFTAHAFGIRSVLTEVTQSRIVSRNGNSFHVLLYLPT
jgi:hypothetical protein